MTLNLWATYIDIKDPDGKLRPVPLRTRYDRISELIAKRLPDIVTFQEVYIRQAWPPFWNYDPADYETVITIIEGINRRAQANYRIAYGATSQPKAVYASWVKAGNVTIYNADRI
jgi:hypothetical protein